MNFTRIEISFAPDREELLAKLGLDVESDEAEDFLALLNRAAPLVRPKAAIVPVRVEAVDEAAGRVVLGGIEFCSKLLAVNLREIETAWPYIATCGRELYDFVMAISDPFERYWGDEIMAQALADVRAAAEREMRERHYSGKMAYMSPGSLMAWPISQQAPLFRLLGEAAIFAGVSLTDTMLMLPNKSISGIRFPNEHGYVNCTLCPREKCPNRREMYNSALAM